MNIWTIYIWGILDAVRDMLAFVCATCLVALVFTGLTLGADEGEDGGIFSINLTPGAHASLSRALKWLIAVSIFTGAVRTFTPSGNTFAAMIILPEIAKSEAIQKDLPEIYSAAVDRLKESLKPDAEKE